MADPIENPERPLAPVRRALDRGQAAIAAALRHGRAEIEARLAECETRIWAQERTIQELEGCLARVAALVGVEVREPASWDDVIGAVADLADRRASAQSVELRAQEALRSRRVQQQAIALARIGARFGLATSDPDQILHAIDKLRR